MVTISRAEYEEFQGQKERISALEQQIALLTEAIRLSRQKRFGASSERSSEDIMEQLSLLFNEAEVYADQTAKEDDNRAMTNFCTARCATVSGVAKLPGMKFGSLSAFTTAVSVFSLSQLRQA